MGRSTRVPFSPFRTRARYRRPWASGQPVRTLVAPLVGREGEDQGVRAREGKPAVSQRHPRDSPGPAPGEHVIPEGRNDPLGDLPKDFGCRGFVAHRRGLSDGWSSLWRNPWLVWTSSSRSPRVRSRSSRGDSATATLHVGHAGPREALDDDGAALVLGRGAPQHRAVHVVVGEVGHDDPVGQGAVCEVEGQCGFEGVAAWRVGRDVDRCGGGAVQQRGCAEGCAPLGVGGLVREREGDEAVVVEGAAEQLQADREAARGEAGRDGERGQPRVGAQEAGRAGGSRADEGGLVPHGR